MADFYPRPPRGGRRRVRRNQNANIGFLSTPSARRATTIPQVKVTGTAISIHALREEGDRDSETNGFKTTKFLSTPSARRATTAAGIPSAKVLHFYPRPPRGGRQSSAASGVNREQFLSTPSARRATAKTETKSLFSNKLYNILHEFRRALIYNGSKNYPNHAK